MRRTSRADEARRRSRVIGSPGNGQIANGGWVNDQRTWGRPGRNSLAGKQRDVKRIGWLTDRGHRVNSLFAARRGVVAAAGLDFVVTLLGLDLHATKRSVARGIGRRVSNVVLAAEFL